MQILFWYTKVKGDDIILVYICSENNPYDRLTYDFLDSRFCYFVNMYFKSFYTILMRRNMKMESTRYLFILKRHVIFSSEKGNANDNVK